MQLFLVKLVVKILELLPFSAIFRLSNLLKWVLFGVIGYRKKVVRQNLANSFPEKSAAEITLIEKGFYQHFCDIFLEALKGVTMSKEELQRRYIFKNPEIFDAYFQNKQSCLMAASHFNNWEWGVLSMQLWMKHQVVGIYKPLNNKAVDSYFYKKRKQWGLELTSMAQTARTVIQSRKIPKIFVLIADQTPADFKNAHWVPFMKQETAFLQGLDKLARDTGYPVIYCEIRRVKRGFYELQLEDLCLQPKALAEGAITQLFAERLEKTIRENPANWLWTHRRWKHRRATTTQT